MARNICILIWSSKPAIFTSVSSSVGFSLAMAAVSLLRGCGFHAFSVWCNLTSWPMEMLMILRGSFLPRSRSRSSRDFCWLRLRPPIPEPFKKHSNTYSIMLNSQIAKQISLLKISFETLHILQNTLLPLRDLAVILKLVILKLITRTDILIQSSATITCATIMRSMFGSQTAPTCPHDHPRVAQHMG